MSDRTFFRAALLALLVALPATSASAGLLGKFKDLLTTTGTAMDDYNKNMWTGDTSVGNSLIKGVKDKNKKWYQVFDDVNAAHNTAMKGAETDVKAVLKVLSDIVLWLPRKLQELFNKLMDKVRAFMAKLGQMNQGATVKERWEHMAGGGAAPPPPPPPTAQAQGGADPAAGPASSIDGEDAASLDRATDIDGVFSKMLELTRKNLTDRDQKVQSELGIRQAYLECWKLVLEKNAKAEAVALLREAPGFYEVDPAGMDRTVQDLAASVQSPMSPELVKASARLAKAAAVQASQN